jgi:hypothetical protein
MESAELQSLSQSIRLCSTVFNAVADAEGLRFAFPSRFSVDADVPIVVTVRRRRSSSRA